MKDRSCKGSRPCRPGSASTVLQNQAGCVRYCAGCGVVQLSSGNVFLALQPRVFAQLADGLEAIRVDCRDELTGSNRVLIPVASHSVYLSLNGTELAALCELTQDALALLGLSPPLQDSLERFESLTHN